MAPGKKKEKEEEFFVNPRGHIRDRILIQESTDIPKEGLFFSLNGFAFLAKAGVEIDIPRPVRKMLDTRIRTETIYGKDGQTYTKDIPRVNYVLIKEDVNRHEEMGFEMAPAAEVIAATQESLNSKVDFPS